LDLHHRLMRQTINIAVSKAIEDMRRDTKRSIRNLIDLGLLFSQSENQKWFFSTAKKVISDVRNPYNKLVSRMIANIDISTIKTVGINLGYSSLTYGANKLQKRQAAIDCSLPWVLIFDALSYVPAFFDRTEAFIREGRELGIYSYIFCPQRVKDIDAICKIAGRFEECVFALKTPPELITSQSVEWIRKGHNIVVSVHVPDTDLNSEYCTRAFHILRDNRCLYGFHTGYNDRNFENLATAEYIHSAISLGSVFGMFIADGGISVSCRNAMYDYVCFERGETGLPLLAFEWFTDMQNISKKIQANGEYMIINSMGEAYLKCNKVENIFSNSLFEIIRNVMPCVMRGNLEEGLYK